MIVGIDSRRPQGLDSSNFSLKKQKLNKDQQQSIHGDEETPQLRCAECGHLITSPDNTIEVNGSHIHRQANPYGIVFEFGCYAAAPGCRQIGESHAAHSWFAAYRWRIDICASCHNHLGWYFQAEDGSSAFHGLISEKLRREP